METVVTESDKDRRRNNLLFVMLCALALISVYIVFCVLTIAL
ncbi:hypothetical protein DYBT9623_05398 [Dyadobacter sp. CECT 9623]|uniref:Uncharacterized protein n=1 Tax=Dyadobacter linearis TaxID=2823330 RepID=A0ABM8UYK7_9BACT|nr:hypothetical protein DYBT9623_05398 [Dyadobacter sp. CECT 9623]